MPEATATLAVWVTAGASDDAIVGLRDGMIHIRVAAPPREGRANAAVADLLARSLKLPKSRAHVAKGYTSRRKQVEVQGISSEEAMRVLGLGPRSAA